ncbi:MAG: RimK/LysX family protein [Candidatus Saccharimonadales bacterium]
MAVKSRLINTLGSTILVDFPVLGLNKVPAKVDTGAASSSVWASSIDEEDGTLQYVLFDRLSPFYTGQKLSTRAFTYTPIRNSFGHTELRYKVRLQIIISGRTIRASFTLADRAKNSSPVLIGRRTLRGKFLVDVSHPHKETLKSASQRP